MNIFKISWLNILRKPLNTALTLIMLALGVALVAVLIQVSASLDEGFRKNIRGIDMAVGAKGSPLQLILSAIYHIDHPTGNIPLTEARELAAHPMVKEAVELSYGDSYKGRRIVGTSHRYPEWYEVGVKQGRLWEKTFEATVGAEVAQEFGLEVGDTFYSAHGSDAEAEVHDDHPFTVVGIFEPSGTVIDRLLLTAQESMWDLHADHGTPAEADSLDEKQITAMLLRFKSKMGILTLPRYVNQQTSMQAALPSIEVNRLFDLFGIGFTALRIVAIVIVVLGAISIFVSMLNTLKERSYEIALIRSMGALRRQVFTMVIIEALVLGVLGYVLGIILAHGGLLLLSEGAGSRFGISIDAFSLRPEEIWLFGLILGLCVLSAVVPAIRAVRMDVSAVLTSHTQ